MTNLMIVTGPSLCGKSKFITSLTRNRITITCEPNPETLRSLRFKVITPEYIVIRCLNRVEFYAVIKVLEQPIGSLSDVKTLIIETNLSVKKTDLQQLFYASQIVTFVKPMSYER